jgi:hypothetical protein
MRNDARPMGEGSPASPIGGDEGPLAPERTSESRDSLKHDRQSHVVNRHAEEDAAPQGPSDVPLGDSTLNTKI